MLPQISQFVVTEELSVIQWNDPKSFPVSVSRKVRHHGLRKETLSVFLSCG